MDGGGCMNKLNVVELIAGAKEEEQVPKMKFVFTFIHSFAALARQVVEVLIDTIEYPSGLLGC